jgi:ribonuclease HII
MGYASDDHRAAIRRLGPCAIHRQSFHGTQRWLFDLVDEPSGAGPTGN